MMQHVHLLNIFNEVEIKQTLVINKWVFYLYKKTKKFALLKGAWKLVGM